MSDLRLVTPGEKIGEVSKQRTAGMGTYVKNQYIFASRCGYVEEDKGVLNVMSCKKEHLSSDTVPQVGQQVLAQVGELSHQ